MKSNPQQTAIYFSILAILSFVLSNVLSVERMELPVTADQNLIISCHSLSIVIGALNAFVALIYASMAMLQLQPNKILNKVYIRITLGGSIAMIVLLGFNQFEPFIAKQWSTYLLPLMLFIFSAQVLLVFNFAIGLFQKIKISRTK